MQIYRNQQVEIIQGAILEPITDIVEQKGNFYTASVPSLSKLRGLRNEQDFWTVEINKNSPLKTIHWCPQKKYKPHNVNLIDHHEVAAILALQNMGEIISLLNTPTQEQIEVYLDGKDAGMFDREIQNSLNKGEDYWEKITSLRRDISERIIMNKILVYIGNGETDLEKYLSRFLEKIDATKKWSTATKYAPEEIKKVEGWETTLARMLSEEELITGETLDMRISQSNIKRFSENVLGTEYFRKKQEIINLLHKQ